MKLLALVLVSALSGAALAQKTSIEDTDKNFSEASNTDDWTYNDLAKGFADAKTAGKPLMVVYRCIP